MKNGKELILLKVSLSPDVCHQTYAVLQKVINLVLIILW